MMMMMMMMMMIVISVLGFDMEWPWLSESTRLQEKVGLIQIASQSHIGLFRKYHSFEPLPKQMQALFCKGLKPLNVIWHLYRSPELQTLNLL